MEKVKFSHECRSKTIDDSSAREQLLRTSSMEMTTLKQELEIITKTKENLMTENRRLQDDLASATIQYRSAQNQIDECKRHIEDLKKQLQTYVAEVKRFEDMMDHKEAERSELLEQFRSLSQEANILESNNHSLQHDATQSKVQLSVTLDHVSDLEEKLSIQDNQIEDYERKIIDLRSQLSKMEEQVNQYREQQYQTANEVMTLRDLCTKLDNQKDKLIRELQEKDEQKIKTSEDMVRLRRESATLQSTLNRDRSSLENLEKLLAEARDESLKQKVINDELEHELKALKEKLNDYEAKLSPTTATAMFTYTTGLLPVPNGNTCKCCSGCPEGKKGIVIDTAGSSILPKTFTTHNSRCKCCGNVATVNGRRSSKDENIQNKSHTYQTRYREPSTKVLQKITLDGSDADRSNEDHFHLPSNQNLSTSPHSTFLFSTNLQSNSKELEFLKKYGT